MLGRGGERSVSRWAFLFWVSRLRRELTLRSFCSAKVLPLLDSSQRVSCSMLVGWNCLDCFGFSRRIPAARGAVPFRSWVPQYLFLSD